MVVLRRTVGLIVEFQLCVADLSTKSVESASLPLQGIDYIHSSDGLALCMLGVGDGITDDNLEE